MFEHRWLDREQFSSLASRVFKYSLATIGPVGAAGAQFILSLQMLHTLTPREFGSFSFLLVALQFSCGIWSALFCSPLPAVVTTKTDAEKLEMLRCLFSANAAGAAIASLLFALLGLSLGLPTWGIVLFALYAAATLLRWFARQHAYLVGNMPRTVLSDTLYSVCLFSGIALIRFLNLESLDAPCAILFGSTAFSLAPFGVRYLAQQFMEISPRYLLPYGAIWRGYSSWSLVGVVSTEATANAHAYLVTSFFGPSAFAPLSASSLLIRPVGIAMMALTDFERPALAQQIQSEEIGLITRSLRIFRFTLIVAWVATAIAASMLTIYAPTLIFPARYSADHLPAVAAIWMIIAALRLLRTPESALLQAAGLFRPLAMASVISSGVSVGLVATLLAIGGPLWSLVGIVIGEASCTLWVHRQTYFWRKSTMGSEVATAPYLLAPASARLQTRDQIGS